MIGDMERLTEVIDEIEYWSLQQRRQYLASLQNAFGKAAADQIRDGLTQIWSARPRSKVSKDGNR
jgi:hypothetical protein